MLNLEKITPIEENFSKWYLDVVLQGQLVDYSNTKGSMIFKPIAYGIWENIQRILNQEFKKEEIQNVYLPLLIPLELIEKEKDHIKGFSPELAIVTHIGERELSKKLVIRPTSEVLFCEFFKNAINSYHDLPLKYNQWANVLRWEKTTKPFLRNREFLWQEGHTVHVNQEEAINFTKKMIFKYQTFLEKYLAIPTVIGKKTEKEKFAGAVTTYTAEAMMKDGKALQIATSHFLGHNFTKAFKIQFKNAHNQLIFPFQTSWGVSTRMIGGIIMVHGDNHGIIIPPKVSLYQIDIIPILSDKNPKVKEITNEIRDLLKPLWRVRIIDTHNKSLGYKIAESEVQGTPIRIEIGPRDLKYLQVTIFRRDTLVKKQIAIVDLKKEIANLMNLIHDNLLQKAKIKLSENIIKVFKYDLLKENIKENKFVVVPFAGDSKDEEQIKLETGATSRCVLDEEHNHLKAKCIITNQETKRYVLFAKAY